MPPNWRGVAQKRNAEVQVSADGKMTLVMKVETAIELGVWAPEGAGKRLLELRFRKAEDNAGVQKK